MRGKQGASNLLYGGLRKVSGLRIHRERTHLKNREYALTAFEAELEMLDSEEQLLGKISSARRSNQRYLSVAIKAIQHEQDLTEEPILNETNDEVVVLPAAMALQTALWEASSRAVNNGDRALALQLRSLELVLTEKDGDNMRSLAHFSHELGLSPDPEA